MYFNCSTKTQKKVFKKKSILRENVHHKYKKLINKMFTFCLMNFYTNMTSKGMCIKTNVSCITFIFFFNETKP